MSVRLEQKFSEKVSLLQLQYVGQRGEDGGLGRGLVGDAGPARFAEEVQGKAGFQVGLVEARQDGVAEVRGQD